MYDKIVGLCESKFGFNPSVLVENAKDLVSIEVLTEAEKKLLGYTVEKVNINCDGTDYFIEYSGNLEKYMKDQSIGLEEAIEKIVEKHELLKESIIIVIDESCTGKMDIAALKENFNVKRV